ncbi:hypothetical protein BDR26DRAFT_869068 [Obelidium mucronatum]|nr:hypothetical protein BDR26DRAFT_869068 [Obelidium mucronatum]
MALCIPLAGSQMCPGFGKAGLSALVPKGVVDTGVTDLASLDKYIKDYSDPNGIFGSFMKEPTIFGCTGWDGTGFRFYASAFCASLVGQGVGSKETEKQFLPLCDSSIGKYVAAYQKVYQNTKFCPKGANVIAQSIVNNVIQLRSSGPDGASLFSKDASTCLISEAGEVNNCGYNTPAEATAFCSMDSTNDPCCVAFPAPKKTTTTTASATTAKATTAQSTTVAAATNSSSGGGLTGSTLYAVIGGVVALVILIVAGLVIFFCCGKKKGAEDDDDYDSDDDFRNGGSGYGMAKRNNRPYSEYDDNNDKYFDDRGRDSRYHHDDDDHGYDSYDDRGRSGGRGGGKRSFESDYSRNSGNYGGGGYGRGGAYNGGRGGGYNSESDDDRGYGGGRGRGGGGRGGLGGGSSRW